MDIASLWHGLGWPLIRLVCSISLGLFIGNLIEALNWTHAVGRLAMPLVRLGRLKDVSGAAFSLAFFSSAASNAMLSEAHLKGRLSDRELVFSNLFNSLPAYFVHLPTMFFITLPFIGGAGVLYIGLTIFAAFLRTFFVVVVGRMVLPRPDEGCLLCILNEERSRSFRQALRKSWERFKKRIRKVLLYSVPTYILIFALNRLGVFKAFEEFLSAHVSLLSFLSPQALGIVIFHMAAELTAGLAMAGALLDAGSLGVREIVLALIVGNVLSSPMRAFRHQFPYYAGIFKPAMALRLIVYSQTLRAASIAAVGAGYYFLSLAVT